MRILICGPDLKFLHAVVRHCAASHEVKVLAWRRGGDTRELAGALDWPDTIVCEWCLDHAVWFSRHVLPRQKLFVRLHRHEIETPYPAQVDWTRVEGAIFVAPRIRRIMDKRLGLNPESSMPGKSSSTSR